VVKPFDSEKLPPTLVSDIRPFLRVANQIEAESPRVAYLCKCNMFYLNRPYSRSVCENVPERRSGNCMVISCHALKVFE
jgi:hypothetical protein